MTILIGLTGGIACGKSQLSTILQQEGIRILDCDIIAREGSIISV
jgi:dephospho-CoA kinase